MSTTVKFILSIAIPQCAGIIGSLFTYSAIESWYSTLEKPVFAPPNWIFAPVWTTLFILMGIALFLIWKEGIHRTEVRFALGLFAVQLILNTLWSIVFFGMRSPGSAFIELCILWIAILGTIVAFARISKTAAILLVPYIAWVTFAGFLNFAIWSLN